MFAEVAVVMLNAGCLVSEIEIPKEVFPCFVTFGNDYWETKNPAFTFQQFKKLAKCDRGLLIHYLNEPHLPSTDTLKHFITQATELTMLKADNTQVQRFWVPTSTPCMLYELTQSDLTPILMESFAPLAALKARFIQNFGRLIMKRLQQAKPLLIGPWKFFQKKTNSRKNIKG